MAPLQVDLALGCCNYGHVGSGSDVCKGRSLLRQDKIEAMVMGMLERLVCPSPQVIGWIADAMREEHKYSIENREKLVLSIQTQIDRVSRMDDGLYDDKLAGEITPNRYTQKHQEFVVQKTELGEKLSKISNEGGQRLEETLVLLELSQKAAKLYAQKSPEQKRLIITNLFTNLTYGDGSVSVKYTNSARAIAEGVIETKKLTEGQL